MVSRTQVAAHVANALDSDRAGAMKSAAAWLVNTGRERQAGYLARDVAKVLAGRGYVSAKVTTARRMSDETQSRIETYIMEATDAKKLELDTVVDPAIIGGAHIETPDAHLDATVRTKLEKFVQGVSR